ARPARWGEAPGRGGPPGVSDRVGYPPSQSVCRQAGDVTEVRAAGGEKMADITDRTRFFDGRFLRAGDFIAEQDYHLDRRRRHGRLLHTSGVANGLVVSGAVGSTTVTV